MGLNMKVVVALVAVLACCAAVGAQNVVCAKGTSSKTVTVEHGGKALIFKTQKKGKKYQPNQDCTVEYKMGSTCAKMSFVCSKSNIINKDKKKKVKAASTGDMMVNFLSGKKKQKKAMGVICKVTCTEEAGSTGNPAPEPIGTVTKVKLELFTGNTGADEPISFDGETLSLPPDTQFDPSKPIKVVIHGWHQASLDMFGNVVVDDDEYPRSFNQLYMDAGSDYTVLGVHWVPIEGWNED